MIDGTDLWVAMNKAKLTVTDVAALAQCSRPTVYAWREAVELPFKAEFLHRKLVEALEAGRLPLKDHARREEHAKMVQLAVYGQ